MVVTENGAFITARAYPKLSTVKPKLDGHFLVLEADGMAPLKLPKVSLRDQNKPLVDTKYVCLRLLLFYCNPVSFYVYSILALYMLQAICVTRHYA